MTKVSENASDAIKQFKKIKKMKKAELEMIKEEHGKKMLIATITATLSAFLACLSVLLWL